MRPRRRGASALALMGTVAGLAGGPHSVDAQEGEAITFALTGDAIITRRLSVHDEPAFLEMVGLIREADAAFTNLEVLFHDYEPFPAHQSGGTWMRADPALAHELAWAGFDMVSRANNHTGDYGVEGLRLTTRYVEEAGLVHAGAGESLAEAREARFLETSRGRVAIVSMASTFPEHSVAGEARGSMASRPGLSPLRYVRQRVVTSEQLERLAAALDDMGIPFRGDEEGGRALGTSFVIGDEPGVITRPDPDDVAAIAAVVRNASRLADHVLVTMHAHERKGPNSVPADFIVEFARAMIDAGATMFVGHGPHVLRGIEIYGGRPILYSLGDFVFQNETLLRLPAENYERYGLGPGHHVADFNDARYRNGTTGFPANREIWESVIAIPKFVEGELIELALHPITLGYGEPAWVRGRPMLARGELASKILADVAERSVPFGTGIEVRDGIGYVTLR
ncbi:MAG: CapA family protein [Longimicrobiales bacterium]|nr:CapA family protein [Longimicrobiales bacterium]